MPETIKILEQTAENEAILLMTLINSLEGDQVYGLAAELATLPADTRQMGTIRDIILIARNIVNISDAIENFHVV